MFGKIISVQDNVVLLENLKKETEVNIINYHVIFSENDRSIVGEITGMDNNSISILLVGEIRDNIFTSGVLKKPSLKSAPRLIFKSELELIIGSQDVAQKEILYIGKSSVYDGYNISLYINDFFANHFAVIGNTGSGKSCGVARLLQNVFNYNDVGIPQNAHIVMFDVYGEYNSALKDLNRLPNTRFKSYTTKLSKITDSELINIPAYYLETDDLALLLNATSSAQIPLIEKSLKYVYIFNSQNEKVISYKNDILAKALLDILSSGKNPTQIRDQIIAVLSKFGTDTLNNETIISQPGYNRTIRQCLNIDSQGKINAMGAVVDFLEQYTQLNVDDIEIAHDCVYTLKDLYSAFEFALISEGVFSSETVFDEANVLKVRLHEIINSDCQKYFETGKEYISRFQYVQNIFTAADGNMAQIINMNLNHIEDRFAKVISKIYTKLFFNYATSLRERATFPIHIILEEAHRYVQNDNDVSIIGYNIFDRITKEGRKYGILLGLITQRPSELSKTALSQCSNFFVFRMFHPDDIKIVSSISSNVCMDTIQKVKTLRPGMALGFGTAFKMPLLINMDLPNPMPESTSVDIVNSWYKENK